VGHPPRHHQGPVEEPQAAARIHERVAILAVTDEQHPQPRVIDAEPGRGLEEEPDPLVGAEARDVARDRVARLDPQGAAEGVISRPGREPLDLDRVRDDHDTIRRNAPRKEVLAHRL
jgi:hypothetical protein